MKRLAKVGFVSKAAPKRTNASRNMCEAGKDLTSIDHDLVIFAYIFTFQLACINLYLNRLRSKEIVVESMTSEVYCS